MSVAAEDIAERTIVEHNPLTKMPILNVSLEISWARESLFASGRATEVLTVPPNLQFSDESCSDG